MERGIVSYVPGTPIDAMRFTRAARPSSTRRPLAKSHRDVPSFVRKIPSHSDTDELVRRGVGIGKCCQRMS
jgi:hypothetical protein